MDREARKRSTADRLALRCPLCNVRLQYVRCERRTHFYRCCTHGVILLTSDGDLRPDDPDRSEVFH